MKIRNGFVSNSSSSSFCIIGLENQNDILKVLTALGYSNIQNKLIDDLNYDYGRVELNDDHDIVGYGYYKSIPSYLGVQIENFGNEKTIMEMKKDVSERFKNIGVNIAPDDIGIYYGELGE